MKKAKISNITTIFRGLILNKYIKKLKSLRASKKIIYHYSKFLNRFQKLFLKFLTSPFTKFQKEFRKSFLFHGKLKRNFPKGLLFNFYFLAKIVVFFSKISLYTTVHKLTFQSFLPVEMLKRSFPNVLPFNFSFLAKIVVFFLFLNFFFVYNST